VSIGSIYDLIQKNGPIPEAQIVKFVKQIVAALAHLQDLKIVHRYNIFYQERQRSTNNC
jgi:serine/threonine protein kinase